MYQNYEDEALIMSFPLKPEFKEREKALKRKRYSNITKEQKEYRTQLDRKNRIARIESMNPKELNEYRTRINKDAKRRYHAKYKVCL